LRGLVQCLGHDFIEAVGIDAAMQLTIDHHRRRQSAIAEAIDGFERHASIGGGLAEAGPEARLGMIAQSLAIHRLAGFSPADFHHMAAGRFAAEIMIEGDDAVDFSAGQIDGFGDNGDDSIRHTAKLILHLMQDFDQFVGAIAVAATDVTGTFAVR